MRFGRLPRESYERLEAYKHNPYVLFFQGASDKTHYWGGNSAPLEYADEVDRIFSSLYFERTRISATGPPRRRRSTTPSRGRSPRGRKKLREVRKGIGELWEREKPQVMRGLLQVGKSATPTSGHPEVRRQVQPELHSGRPDSRRRGRSSSATSWSGWDGIEYSI